MKLNDTGNRVSQKVEENGANILVVRNKLGEVHTEVLDIKQTVEDTESNIEDMCLVLNTTTT